MPYEILNSPKMDMGTKWDVDKIENQKGKVVIVTGANSGIGYETNEFNIANYSRNKLNRIYLKRSIYVLNDICI